MSTTQATMKRKRTLAAPAWAPASGNELSAGRGLFVEGGDETLRAIMARRIPAEWQDPEYRRASMEAEVANTIAWQVRVNREERGWTQHKLASFTSTRQSAISKLEDPDGGDVRVGTLLKVAHAFDCALLVKFVPYSVFAAETADVRPNRLVACSFADEQTPLVRILSPEAADQGGMP